MMIVPISSKPTRTSSLFFIVCSFRSGSECEASCSKVSCSGSACEASCLKVGGEEKRGERIENENRDRCYNHCLCGAASDTLRTYIGGVALVSTKKCDRSAEQDGLDHAVHYLERCERQPKTFGEGGRGHVGSGDRGEHRRADTDRVGDDGQSRYHDQGRDQTRH